MWQASLLTSFPGTSQRKTKLRRNRKLRFQRPAVEWLERRHLMAAGYLETNLVSNQAGAALLQDPALNLPWGIALQPSSGNFWVDNTGSGLVTLYGGDVNGSPLGENPLTVQIPGGVPTAVVFNDSTSSTDFVIASADGQTSAPATFLFATLDGKISGWNASVSQDQAIQVAQTSGAYYTGLAIGNNGSGNFLYAADFQHGKIDVFDGNFQPATLSGAFADPNLPAGYAPFNIQNIDGKLYVTYAAQQSAQNSSDQDEDDQHGEDDRHGSEHDASAQHDNEHGHGGQSDDDHDDQSGGGVFTPAANGGIVDVFDLNGNLLNRFAANGTLNAPWGLAMAPTGFGQFSGDLLVGNFGDGKISAFKSDGTFDGQLTNAAGNAVSIQHLLGLSFGNGATAGDADTLYFTAAAAALSPSGGTLNSSGYGIVLLDASGQGALSATGEAHIHVANGGIAVDSSNAAAIFLAGQPEVSASQVSVVGSPGLDAHGHPELNVNVDANATAVVDPLASLNPPPQPSSSFNAVNATGHATVTLQPGVYNGGISVGDHATVTLMPGVYYLQGGGISVTGEGLLQGQGVTIYIASTGGGPALKVSGEGAVDLTAPSSGDLQGIALFVDRGVKDDVNLSGHAVVHLTGTLYAPGATVNVAGESKLLLAGDAQGNVGSQLIASDLNVKGEGKVDVRARAAGGPFSLFGSLQAASDTTPLNILGATLSAIEGQTFSGAVAAFTDAAANAAAVDFTATIDWGDGSSSAGTIKATGNGGFLVTGKHVYAEQGTQNAVVTLQDKNGATLTAADTVQVADAPILAVGRRIDIGQSLDVTGVTAASFVDTGGADQLSDYTANIDWGDGASSAGTVALDNGTLNVTGSHTYASAGQYPVTVTLTDEGGETATAHSVAAAGMQNDDDVFVSDAFQQILDRPADRASLMFFVNALQHGLTRQQFASLLTHSDEYLDDKIERNYQHYLGRSADHAGLAFWLSLLRGGMTDEQLEAQFIGSAEYFQHAGGTNQAWVQQMYFDLLGRLPDNGGLAYWLQALSAGGSRSQAAIGFAASAEREGIAVQNNYQTFLGRTPGQSEVDGWVSNFRNGTTNEDVIAGFVGSREYYEHHGGGGGDD